MTNSRIKELARAAATAKHTDRYTAARRAVCDAYAAIGTPIGLVGEVADYAITEAIHAIGKEADTRLTALGNLLHSEYMSAIRAGRNGTPEARRLYVLTFGIMPADGAPTSFDDFEEGMYETALEALIAEREGSTPED